MLLAGWHIPESVTAAEAAVRLNPALVDGHWALASASYAVGDYGRAIAVARHALSAWPRWAWFRQPLAMSLAADGQGPAALAVLDQLLQLSPGVAETHTVVGWTHWHLGRLDDAATAFTEALRIDPAFPWQHEGMAHVRYAQGRRADAVGHFRDWDLGTFCKRDVRRSLRRFRRHVREANARSVTIGLGSERPCRRRA